LTRCGAYLSIREYDATRPTGGRHLAREADINLPAHDDFVMTLDTSDGFGLDIDVGGDFGDLGVTFGGDEPEMARGMDLDMNDDSLAVELGRDAMDHRSAHESVVAVLRGDADLDRLSVHSKEPPESRFDDLDMNLDFGEAAMDLGIDFGAAEFGAASEPEKTPGVSRACKCFIQPRVTTVYSGWIFLASPLTAPPTTPPPNEEPQTPAKKTPKKRKLKEKKQVIDSITELRDGPGAKIKDGGLGAPTKVDVSDIVRNHGYLSSSPTVMRLLEIRADPIAHFFPTISNDRGTFLCAAPPGLAPELVNMFLFPTTGMGSALKRKHGAAGKEGPDLKRPRLENQGAEVDEVEVLRRQSVAPSIRGDEGIVMPEFDESGGVGVDMDMGVDMGDIRFDIDESLQLPANEKAASRHTTPGAEEYGFGGERSYADVDCPVAMFDTQATSTQQNGVEDEAHPTPNDKGYSKNTLKALGLLRKELQPTEDDADPHLSFAATTDKV
jgi:cohesin complex subunit SCC1